MWVHMCVIGVHVHTCVYRYISTCAHVYERFVCTCVHVCIRVCSSAPGCVVCAHVYVCLHSCECVWVGAVFFLWPLSGRTSYRETRSLGVPEGFFRPMSPSLCGNFTLVLFLECLESAMFPLPVLWLWCRPSPVVPGPLPSSAPLPTWCGGPTQRSWCPDFPPCLLATEHSLPRRQPPGFLGSQRLVRA